MNKLWLFLVLCLLVVCINLQTETKSSQLKDCIVVMGGGMDTPEVNVTVADGKTLDFCDLLRTEGRFDVVCLDNFTYPSNKPKLDTIFLNLSVTHSSLFLFGISGGAVVVLDYAQKSTLFKSAIVCSAPVDYWRKSEWYWHLTVTANQTKITVLYVLPSQDPNLCGDMQTYYDRDTVLPKRIVMWNTLHNPLDYDPVALSSLVIAWYATATA